MEAGRRPRYVARLIKHFGNTPLAEIDQAAINSAAIELFPHATPGTRNACVYTPVSAILRHAGVDMKLRRPKGAKGRVVTDWLRHEDARGIIQAADDLETEFGLLLRFLLFTGLRLGEVLSLRWSDIDLESGTAWVTRKKGGIASDIRMRDDLRARMAAHGPWHIVISRRDIWNSDGIGPIGFCSQLGLIVVIGMQVKRSVRVH